MLANHSGKTFLTWGKTQTSNSKKHKELPLDLTKQTLMRHIIVKFTKYTDKERIMKASRGKKSLTYKSRPIRFTAYLYIETWQARNEWQDMLNPKNMQPRILYPEKLSFKI